MRVLMLVGDKTRFFVLPASARWNETHLPCGLALESSRRRRISRRRGNTSCHPFHKRLEASTLSSIASLSYLACIGDTPRFFHRPK